jgi:transposase
MAMGKRRQRQEALFLTTEGLARSPGHPFYRKLNELLAEAEFDRWIERRCERFYEQQETRGQRSIPPGVYFRMLLVGYFEGIESQRGIAWRCADSLSLRQFLGIGLDQSTPDHSTLTNTRQRLPAEVFEEVFQFVLRIASEKKLLAGKTVGVDSTTLEANAAMKSIVRRDTGEDWNGYVTRLMREDGTIEPDEEPTDEDIRRYDKRRKNKRVSNDEWQSPSDPQSRITKLKDGRTHLAYKAELVVDLESELVVAAEVYPGDQADTDTLADSLLQAQVNLNEAKSKVQIEEAAADKGYHAAHTLELCQWMGVRTYVPEPRRVHRSRWTDKPEKHHQAVLANRRRTKRDKGKRLQRLRSERCERSFAHVCDTGGTRRSWLRGAEDVSKRYLIAVAAHNLGRILRMLFGVGKPKALQGVLTLAALVQLLNSLIDRVVRRLAHLFRPIETANAILAPIITAHKNPVRSTGC